MSQTTDQRITLNPMTGLESPREPEKQQRTLWQWVQFVLAPIASLRLTVVLFSLSLALVFLGTLAQVEMGISSAVDHYFRSAFVWVPWQLFVKFSQVFFGVSKEFSIGGSFPFFGGWLLGGLLLVNLLAAHLVRFKLSWKRSGILLIHAGLIIMMVSELVTGLFAIEARMTMAEGETINFVDTTGVTELAITGSSDPEADDVVVIPGSLLKKEGRIRNDELPVDVHVVRYWTNSNLISEEKVQEEKGPIFTSRIGTRFKLLPRGEESGAGSERSDVPSVQVRFLKKGTEEVIGEHYLSLWFYPNMVNRLPAFRFPDQHLEVDGKKYTVELRPKRTYRPYSLHLIKFTHDVYPGTKTPKNYASLVRLTDPVRHENREIEISMNDPLRYAGETFYQSGFLPDNKGTILQVVRNPGWLMPYISCAVVSLGMLIHFGLHLVGFLRVKLANRIASPLPAPTGSLSPEAVTINFSLIVPSLVLGSALLLLMLSLTSSGPMKGAISLDDCAAIPVVMDGRVKPLDSVGRANLLIISKKQSFKDQAGDSQPAIRWLLDAMTSEGQDPETSPAWSYRVFRIENDQVLNFLKLEHRPGSLRYSLREIGPHYKKLHEEAERIQEGDSKNRTLFDQKILELRQNLELYLKLAQGHEPRIIPSGSGDRDWRSYHEIRTEALQSALMYIRSDPELSKLDKEKQFRGAEMLSKRIMAQHSPAADAWRRMLEAYRDNQPVEFSRAVTDFRKLQGQLPSSADSTARFEVFFNSFSPFHLCYGLYVIAFVLACAAWIGYPHVLNRAALWLALLTVVVHAWALCARMYIQGRPPVTNLYSSAVFIGWGCVVLGLFLERVFRNGIGVATASILGAATSLVANYLAESKGDTLEMMQAVLDTNFWLATHVTCITLGYSATFFAGFLGLIFIVLGVFTNRLDRDTFRSLGQMIYGVLCFATLLSFVGTVLGGIWADQSWGRFWGWDPKENGALLIVIINALILHARWAGLVKQRGMAVLTLVGNMVTGWSWFGTNQLGVGLHSYGFSNALAAGLTIFWVTQLACIGLGLVPTQHWKSYGRTKSGVSAES